MPRAKPRVGWRSPSRAQRPTYRLPTRARQVILETAELNRRSQRARAQELIRDVECVVADYFRQMKESEHAPTAAQVSATAATIERRTLQLIKAIDRYHLPAPIEHALLAERVDLAGVRAGLATLHAAATRVHVGVERPNQGRPQLTARRTLVAALTALYEASTENRDRASLTEFLNAGLCDVPHPVSERKLLALVSDP